MCMRVKSSACGGDSRAVACAMVALVMLALLLSSVTLSTTTFSSRFSATPLIFLQPEGSPCPPAISSSRYQIEISPGLNAFVTTSSVTKDPLSLCTLRRGVWSQQPIFWNTPNDDFRSSEKHIAATDRHRVVDEKKTRVENGGHLNENDALAIDDNKPGSAEKDIDKVLDVKPPELSEDDLRTLRDKIVFILNNEEEEKDKINNGILPEEKSIDLSNTIDVNYLDNKNYRESVKDNSYFKYESNKDLDYNDDIDFVPIPNKFKRKGQENTWNGFSKTVPRQWIDLSHDVDVNYPDVNVGTILNVEDKDVERNIYMRNDKTKHEFQYEDVDTSSQEDKIETMEKFRKEIRKKRDAEQKEEDRAEPRVQEKTGNDSPKIDSPRIDSLRIEQSDKEMSTNEEGVPVLLSGTSAVIRLFGSNISANTWITFTQRNMLHGAHCEFPSTDVFFIEKDSVNDKSAKVKIVLPSGGSNGPKFYICAKNVYSDNNETNFIHQGSESWLQIETYDKLLPLWASLIIIGTCLFFSALFSGLNLGLMSLDRTELKILCNTGTENEKRHAKTIQPVRDHGNYLLCSILLGNVAVNSTFTILLDDLTSGVFAVIFSTIAIVLLGEITPQAICSRHGLAVGAKTIHITKAVMLLTFPLSYPVSKLLDFLLGEEIGNVYNRERLKELVKVTNDINDLDKDEVNIISGALELHKKTVSDVMTKIDDVFMLDYEAVLDFETVSEIMKSGFSRIPVYEGNRTNIVAMLYIKDLVFIDPDDNTPLKTLCQFYQNPCNFLFEDVTLDVIFKQFKEGHKGHMAFVQHINSEGEGDPFYETIGLVTLEDVIEELIQSEIVDETDVFTDNRSKRRRNRPANKLQDFGVFAERRENQRIRISPQLTLATFQYLSTSVDAFKPDVVSETILRRLLKQDIIHHIKYRGKDRQKNDPLLIIYEAGKNVDYFVLILEGRVEVTVGREKLVFESGPFTYFGIQALTQNIGVEGTAAPSTLGSLQAINMDSILRHTFIPDYSVRAVTEVFYIQIKRSLYLAAKRATLVLKCSGNRSKETDDSVEQFDDEVEKLLHSLDEEPSPVETARSPSHNASIKHTSPTGQNGSVRKSQQLSPSQITPHITSEAPTAETVPHEASALLPS